MRGDLACRLRVGDMLLVDRIDGVDQWRGYGFHCLTVFGVTDVERNQRRGHFWRS